MVEKPLLGDGAERKELAELRVLRVWLLVTVGTTVKTLSFRENGGQKPLHTYSSLYDDLEVK